MKRIYKKIIIPGSDTSIRIQAKSSDKKDWFLKIDKQKDNVCIWYINDDALDSFDISISTFGTGHDIEITNIDDKYLGTLLFHKDSIVLHFFISDSTMVSYKK